MSTRQASKVTYPVDPDDGTRACRQPQVQEPAFLQHGSRGVRDPDDRNSMNAVDAAHTGHGQRLESGTAGINDCREQPPVGCFAAPERELPVIATKLLAGR